MCGLEAFGLGLEPVMSPCEHSNEPFGPISGREFLDWLSDYQLLKKDSAPFENFSWNKVRNIRKVKLPLRLNPI
jgi:hypothetical protein